MGLNPVNGVLTDDSHPGLSNSKGNILYCHKKTRLNIDLNEVDNEQNELDLNDMVSTPVDGEVFGVQNVEDVLSDTDRGKNKLDLVSNDVGSAKVSSGFPEDENPEESEDANVETIVVTCGQKRRSERVSKKEREAASTIGGEVDVNAEADMDTSVPKRKRGKTPKERKVESNAEEKVGVCSSDDANIGTVVGTSGQKRRSERVSKKEREAASTIGGEVDVNAKADMDTSVPKNKRGKTLKERKVESNAEEKVGVGSSDDANIGTVVGTSGQKRRSERVLKKEREAASTIGGEVDVDAEADMDTSVSKNKRGKTPKERKVESNAEEKVGVSSSDDGNIGTVVGTSGQKRRSERVSKKEREAASTIGGKVDVDAEADMDTSVSKNKRGKTPKERKVESNAEEKVGVSSSDDANIGTVVGTSGQKRRSERVSKKEREAASTIGGEVDVNAEAYMDTSVPKNKRGKAPKERKVESNTEEKVGVSSGDDANIGTVVGTSGPRIRFGKLRKKKGKSTSSYNKKVDVNAEPDIDTSVLKKKRGRSQKEREVESDPEEKVRVSAGDDADTETSVGTSGPRIWFGKMPKIKGKATSTFYKKANADMEIIVPKRKRDRLPMEWRVESTVEEKVRVRRGVKKGGNVDNAGDEEDVVDMPASLSEIETGGRRNEDDDSEHMEFGDDAAVSPHGDKCEGKHKSEKGKRGRKRKMVESSVYELDNGAHKRKHETPFDGVSKVVGRVLRSRAVLLTNHERKETSDLSSNKVNEKMIEVSTHLPARKGKKPKGLRGRPTKVENNELLKITGGEKRKRHGLRGIGLDPSSKKVIKGSKSGDTAEQQKETSYSEGKGEKVGTQKQLLKERIKAMLKKAGWTIEFKPRRGKENVYDKVYVSSEGKGYWSVTLAYKILKERVESGKASSMELKAYFPIAEDDWKSLLRITKKQLGLENKSKKSKEVKDQSSKVISRIKNLRKKHAKEKYRLGLKQKATVKRSNGKERKNKKRFTILARGSKKGSGSEGEDFSLYEGQRNLLSWMIDLGTVPLGAKIKCMNSRRTKVLREGKLTKDGIKCYCCTKVLAVEDFDCHSGSSLGLPFQSICLDSKTSLLRCLKDSWSKYAESVTLGFHSVIVDGDDPNDDTCNMCGDGGNLICCDSCPSALHQKCLNIQKFPSGDWNCVYCCCKFCGIVGESTADEDQNCDNSVPALLACRLCEEKYHPLCAQGKATSDKEPNFPEFCSQMCQEILNQLEVLLGVKHQLEEGFSWTLIQHSNDNLDISSLIGAKNVESNAKLAVAWSVMDECFLPIVDRRSGINMMRNVVYSCGSNIRRLNYTGFFIAILERGDEIISAAAIRIHGNLLAEMPFIGTRNAYRRQGMCRRLLSAVEMVLSSLNVEKLVLPAIPTMKRTWTSVFGFMPVEDSLKKEMKCMNIIAFPGVDMLQKPVTKQLTDAKSNGIAYMNRKLVNCQDSVVIDDKDSKKDGISRSRDASDENEKKVDIPSESCKLAAEEVEGITAVSETVSDPVNCEMKTAHIADRGT